MRKSGILLHISSLPSNYGIGTFGKEAYNFVDKLSLSNQSYWQILPIGPTSYGDSPYQSFSSFSINPYFIDLDILVNQGLLENEEIDYLQNSKQVDYGYIYDTRFKVLYNAFLRFDSNNLDYLEFIEENKIWLEDYSLFMAIKKHFGDGSWEFWPKSLRTRDIKVLDEYRQKLSKDIAFHKFMQFKAFEQWHKLKEYANINEVEIIGDMPIYVAYDSADVWSNPKNFKLDSKLNMKAVAGVPPDPFTKDGQLWGNPLYDWKYLKEDNYTFWVERMKYSSKLFDIIRIDHFIGFVNYYQVPASDNHARNGKWIKGPGIDLFHILDKKLGNLNIIAEDLGAVTPAVIKLLKDTNFPGMKLLQFGFDGNPKNDNLTHFHTKNSIIYTGTHDNETTKSWFNNLKEHESNFLKGYINEHNDNFVIKSLIKEVHKSIADTVIIPMQDYLELDNEARMNFPSTIGNNWKWRMNSNDFNSDIVEFIKGVSYMYGRNLKEEAK